MKPHKCRWCRSPATHQLNGKSYCCAHFDEVIEHSADLPGEFGKLIVLAAAGEAWLLTRPKKREGT